MELFSSLYYLTSETGRTLPCSHWTLLFFIMTNSIPDHPSLVSAFVWAQNKHLKIHPGLSCSLIQNVKTIRKIISIWRGGNAVGSTLLPRQNQQREREAPLQPLKKCCQSPSRSPTAGMANHLYRARDGDTGRYWNSCHYNNSVNFLCARCCIFYLVGALRSTSLAPCLCFTLCS